jgi:carbamoyltransferase
MTGGLTIVGVSAHYHDAACCLLRDGELIAAIQEERLTRVKHDPSTPSRAFRECLALDGLDVSDVACLAYYEDPALKAERIRADKMRSASAAAEPDPLRKLRRRLGYMGEIRCFHHHQSHAASAFYPSGFDRAAILTVDGVGEWTTTGYWWADRRDGLELLEEVRYPHSLGLFYSALTAYLGFSVNDS